MTQLPTCFLATTAVTRLAHSRTVGTGGWLLVFVPSSDWNGSVVIRKNTAAPGTIPASPRSSDLTAVAWFDNIQATPAQGGMNTNAAGTPITRARTIIVPLPDYSVWADTTANAGSMVVQVMTYDAPVVTTAANLSQLTIDAVPITYPEDIALQFQLAGNSAGTLA